MRGGQFFPQAKFSRSSFLTLPYLAAGRLASFGLAHAFEIAWKSALVLLLWSGADYSSNSAWGLMCSSPSGLLLSSRSLL